MHIVFLSWFIVTLSVKSRLEMSSASKFDFTVISVFDMVRNKDIKVAFSQNYVTETLEHIPDIFYPENLYSFYTTFYIVPPLIY